MPGMTFEATPSAPVALRARTCAAWRVFAATRAAVLLVAVFAALSFGPATGGLAAENAQKFDEPALTHPLGGLGDTLLSPLARWDSVWYLRIAGSGYGGQRGARRVLPALPAARARSLRARRRLRRRAADRRLPGVAGRLPGGARAAPPAGGARARARAGRLRRCSCWRSSRGALLRGALLREPLPARSVGAFYAARTGRWAAAGACAGRGVGHPQRRASCCCSRSRCSGGARGRAGPRDAAWLALAPARDGGIRALPRAQRGRRPALPRGAGRLVARLRRALRGRLGRAPRPRSTARASWARASARTCTSSEAGGDPYRVAAHQHHAARLPRVRGRGLGRASGGGCRGLRRVRGRGAGAAALVPGGPAAADVAATLPRGAVPDLHVARRWCARSAGAPTRWWRSPPSGSACSRPSTRPGTSSREPARRSCSTRSARSSSFSRPRRGCGGCSPRPGFEVDEERAGAGFGAEIAYYLEHHLEGSDRASLDDLRDRCAEALREGLGAAGARPRHRPQGDAGGARVPPFPDAAPGAATSCGRDGARLVVVSNWDCSLPEWLRPTGLLEPGGRRGVLGRGGRREARSGAVPARARAGRRRSRATALHVGDSLENDVEGARAAGVRAVLVDRGGSPPPGVRDGALARRPRLPSLRADGPSARPAPARPAGAPGGRARRAGPPWYAAVGLPGGAHARR